MTTTFAVVGIHGYGKQHLAELERMRTEGHAEVVAVADPRGGADARHLPAGIPVHADLDALLGQVVPDVVVIATPIHTHLALATQALRAGSAVLLEKPTTASLAEFTALTEVEAETGRPVQVGFQSFGSLALDRIAEYIAAGAIGEVTGIGGIGLWRRARSYYDRSRWAGRRHLDVPTLPGPPTAPPGAAGGPRAVGSGGTGWSPTRSRTPWPLPSASTAPPGPRMWPRWRSTCSG